MRDIEKFFETHRSEFDDCEPEPDHFTRFEKRLNDAQAGRTIKLKYPVLFKIAALLLLLITLSVFVFDLKTHSFRTLLGIAYASAELPYEVKEAMQYYDGQAIQQLDEINKLSGSSRQAKDLNLTVIHEMQSLDDNTVTLKKAFSENPGNERILAALIQNQQMKETVTKTILLQLNQSKK